MESIMSTLCCPRCGEAVSTEPAPPSLRCSAEVYESLGRSLAHHRQERFYAVSLDARNRVVRRHLVAVGSLAAVVVHPREVFAPLLRDRAAAAIIMHNHPSGSVEPSSEDLAITQRLAEAGRLLGIPLLDHIIVGRNGYCSLRDVGEMGAA
jgi:DNA repair protein RadC